MKSLSLKVMTLLMAALVLSASGCINDERSSPEGTVEGYLKALKHDNRKRWNRVMYLHPTTRAYYKNMNVTHLDLAIDRERITGKDIEVSNVKTTLASKKEGSVMLDDKKWHRVKNKNATVEVSYKLFGENFQQTVKLVLLDNNKWYITSWE